MLRKKNRSKPSPEENQFKILVDKKVVIVKEILENVHEILSLFRPIVDKMIKMENSHQYRENGTFKRAANLFGEISRHCKDLQDFPSAEFLKNLAN